MRSAGPLVVLVLLLVIVALMTGSPRRGLRTALSIVAVIAAIVLMATLLALIGGSR